MPVSEEDPVVSYATLWLSRAREELLEEPYSPLYNLTDEKHLFSEGCVWEDKMDAVYFKPATLDQKYLQFQVHEIMLTALNNAFYVAETSRYKGLLLLADISEIMRLMSVIVSVDPYSVIRGKVRLNEYCKKRLGTSLQPRVRSGFRLFMAGPAVPF